MKVFLVLCILWVVCSYANQDLPFVKPHIERILSSFSLSQPTKQQQQLRKRSTWAKVSVYNNLECDGTKPDVIIITKHPYECSSSCKILPDFNSSQTTVCEAPDLPSSSDYFGLQSYVDKKCKQLDSAIFYNKKTYPDYKGCGAGTYVELQCYSWGILNATVCPVSQCGGQDPDCHSSFYASECTEKFDWRSGYSSESFTRDPCLDPARVSITIVSIGLAAVIGCLLCVYALFFRAGSPFKDGKEESQQEDMFDEYNKVKLELKNEFSTGVNQLEKSEREETN